MRGRENSKSAKDAGSRPPEKAGAGFRDFNQSIKDHIVCSESRQEPAQKNDGKVMQDYQKSG